MSNLFRPFMALPAYGIGGVFILLLYAVQSEVRFGARARTMSPGRADRGSTLVVSLAATIPVIGFVVAMKVPGPARRLLGPLWLGALPGIPAAAWVGVG